MFLHLEEWVIPLFSIYPGFLLCDEGENGNGCLSFSVIISQARHQNDCFD